MKTKIRKSTLLLLGMLMLVPTLNAQNHRNDSHRERRAPDSVCQFHGARNLHNKLKPKKVGYITQELQLTEQEAKDFWPIYDKYEQELMAVRDKHRPKDTTQDGFPQRPDFLNMSNSKAEEMFTNHFKVQKEVLALEEKYFNEMKKAIPVQKVNMLFHVEKRFLTEVIGKNFRDKDKRGRRR
ncbi:MAG: hypothetical protein VB048_12005 [Bacteroidaceae bacterium]|nr:hypothetical protein [Bacteroidaceae bacterium]